jgi:DNA polymerase-1
LGYVETLFGRRRYLPEINSSIEQVRAMAERMAINHPIQGTAADLIKMAMIEIDKEIERRGWDDFVKMLLQVHDELVFEVSQKFIEKAVKMIKEKMENVYKLRVPLEVEIKIGKNWGELTP